MASVQKILRSGVLGDNPLKRAAANWRLDENRPKCASCEYGKAKRHAKTDRSPHKPGSQKKHPKPEKTLSKDVLYPGEKVSMDHFIVSTPGRLFSSRGSDRTDQMYKGGVIFVDHATEYVYVAPVVNFTAGEALRAKQEFEAELESMGVTVLKYHTNNGVFTAAEFQDELV